MSNFASLSLTGAELKVCPHIETGGKILCLNVYMVTLKNYENY